MYRSHGGDSLPPAALRTTDEGQAPPFSEVADKTSSDSCASTASRYHWAIDFTGSGSEYFRIWIVNLLLTIMTLGLYYPWARVRRLRYFYTNTLVGQQPLDFHAEPKKMLRGYLLAVLLFGAYSLAGEYSSTAGLVAFLCVMAIWPLTMNASLQFRMSNTSWSGLRFHFSGSAQGAYAAALPLFLPGLVFLALLMWMADPEQVPAWLIPAFGALSVITLLSFPWLYWRLKNFQHRSYGLASQHTRFKASAASFYGVFAKALGLLLLAGAAMGLVVMATFELSGLPHGRALGAALAPLAAILVFLVAVTPYLTSRMQNLVWSKTGNGSLRFVSDLSFRSMLGLTLKNWALMLVTLGLYWPFAAVAVARLRLESVRMISLLTPKELVAQSRAVQTEALGDAAGDVFGFEMGL